MADDRRIIAARIEVALGKGTLIVDLEDGTTSDRLFSWYVDEHSFAAAGFVGMTASEAYSFFHHRDVDFLRS